MSVSKFSLKVMILVMAFLAGCGSQTQSAEPPISTPLPDQPTTAPDPTPTTIPEPSPEPTTDVPMSEDSLFIEHKVEYGTFDYVSGLTLFDIDGDIDLDIVGAAIKEGELAWWQNNGSSPIEWKKQVIEKLDEGALYVHAADFDGDGDGDVIASGIFEVGTIAWWRNDGGEPIQWTKFVVRENMAEPHGVFFADMDGDRDIDILGTEAKANSILFWENTSGENGEIKLVEHVVTEDFIQTQSVMAADMDKDGKIDILASAMSSKIAWWRNQGGEPIEWEKQIISDDFISAHWAEAGDIDGNDTMDALGAAYSSDEIAVWYNDGKSPITWTKQVLDDNFSGALTVIPADLDDDGDLDVIGTSNNGNWVTWWRNDGGDPIQWVTQVIKSGFYGAWPVTAGDIDGDGDVDVVGGGDTMKTILFWENTLYSPEEPKVTQEPEFIPLDTGLEYQEIPLLTDDGVYLNGFAYQPAGGPTRQAAIFLGHESGASHMAWEEFALELSKRGYLVITIDFRGHSATGGPGANYATNGTDVRAALDYIQENGYSQIVCIGSSMGGTGCLAAAKSHDIAALGMISSPKVIVRNADKITKLDLESFDFPKVIAVAENDRALFNDPDFVNDILKMYEQMVEPKQLFLLPGIGHGTELLYGDSGDELRQALLDMIESVSQ